MEVAPLRYPKKQRLRPGLGRAVAVATGALSLLLGGCQQLSDLLGLTDPWVGYRDSSYNFISNLGFDKQDQSLASYQSTAVWTWAWRGLEDAGSFPYEHFDAAGADQGSVSSLGSVPSGLDPNARAYLLDLANLLPSADADFETAASLWRPDIGVVWSYMQGFTGSRVYQVKLGTLTVPLGLALELGQLVNKGTLTPGKKYPYFVRLKSNDPNLHYITSLDGQSQPIPFATTTALPTLTGGSTIPTTAYPQVSPVSIANEYVIQADPILTNLDLTIDPALYFGTSDTSVAYNGQIDDVRILRSDVATNSKLRLLLKLGDTSPSLASGLWSFVVWVLVPSSRNFVDETAARNPYASTKVTLSMEPLIGDLQGFSATFVLDSKAKTQWQRLELKMTNGNFDFPSSSSLAAVELSIAPTDLHDPDSGGILVAQPELHFFLNGY